MLVPTDQVLWLLSEGPGGAVWARGCRCSVSALRDPVGFGPASHPSCSQAVFQQGKLGIGAHSSHVSSSGFAQF